MFTALKNKLIYNFLSTGIVQGIITLLQLLVIPYTIKKIGIDGFGVVAVAQVVMLYLSGFTDYGFNQTATRNVSVYRSDRTSPFQDFFQDSFCQVDSLSFRFYFPAHLNMVCSGVSCSYSSIPGSFCFRGRPVQFGNLVFPGVRKNAIIALLTLLGRIIFVVLVFAFLKKKEQDFLFLFFLGAGTLVAGIISIFSACRLLKLEFIRPSLV
jgi:PST family polysaccharide transporter